MAGPRREPLKRVRFVASGDVQGVFFRASTRDEACRLGVSGWVGNRGDGAVEGEVQGHDDGVAALLDFIRGGPGHAAVDEVEIHDVDPVQDERGFGVR